MQVGGSSIGSRVQWLHNFHSAVCTCTGHYTLHPTNTLHASHDFLPLEEQPDRQIGPLSLVAYTLKMSSPVAVEVRDNPSFALGSPLAELSFFGDEEANDVTVSFSVQPVVVSPPFSPGPCPGSRSVSPKDSEEDEEVDNEDSRPLVGEKDHYGSLKPKGKRFKLGFGRGASIVEPSDPRCTCHTPAKKKDNKARNKLLIATFCVLIFMIAETVGGILSNSLAILTDAAHMFSDLTSFMISLFSIWMANRPPTKLMSFGWHRVEVLGALVSVLLIWLLTGVLVYEAILRAVAWDYEINADIMLITACVGVYINTFMVFVLHEHSHGHSHGGHSDSNGDAHDHGDSHSHSHSHGCSIPIPSCLRCKRGRSSSCSSAGGGDVALSGGPSPMKKKGSKNINVQAAFVHVIGDLVQSIGVVIAAFVIRLKDIEKEPKWKLADPICTFLFSILVLISTFTVLRDALRVILEGTPRGVSYQQVLKDLQAIKGVKLAHSLHIWSLTTDKPALSAHLAIDANATNFQEVLSECSSMLHSRYGFHHTTLQVEDYQHVMSECGKCQEVLPSTTSAGWLMSCFCSSA